MKLKELMDYTGQVLQIARFKDYCPNGLQVEGRPDVGHIISGVTASMDLLVAAQAAGADLIIVHHGYFWRNEDARIVGMKRKRLKFLLEHDISLAAYHLPLDAHPELGNNAQLGNRLGFRQEGWAGEQELIAHGRLQKESSLAEVAAEVGQVLERQPLMLGDPAQKIHRVAWCTGAAQGYMEQAINLGVDLFISGEVSEQNAHLARESGVSYLAAGHHATERYGIKALGAHLAQQFHLKHTYIEIDNPV